MNKAWSEKNIQQKSKLDVVEVGDNWKNFYWPSKVPIHHLKGKSSTVIIFTLSKLTFLDISDNQTNYVEIVTQKLFHPEAELERKRQSFRALAFHSAMGNRSKAMKATPLYFRFFKICPSKIHWWLLKSDL